MILQQDKAEVVANEGRQNKPGFFSRVWLKLTTPSDRGEKYPHLEAAVSNNRFQEKQNAILKKGARAKATVLRVEATGQEINRNPVMLLSLRIDEYTSVVIQVTSEAVIMSDRMLKSGERIVIAFDPDDTGIIVVL
jgi:hypothetical protein